MVTANELTGEPIWSRRFETNLVSNVVVAGSVVWVAAGKTSSVFRLHALDLQTGEVMHSEGLRGKLSQNPLSVLGDTLACAVGKSIHFYRSSA